MRDYTRLYEIMRESRYFFINFKRNKNDMEQAPKQKKISQSVINHLIEMQQSKEIHYFQDHYLYWDKIKYKTKHHNKQEIWTAIKLHRSFMSKTLFFGKYKFTYPTTDFLQKSLHLIDTNIGGNPTNSLPYSDKNRFIINSIIEESISSSQMEGANTTRKQALEMIQQENKPKNKSEWMIMNNYVTMQHIVQIKEQALTRATLLEIHKIISKNTLNQAEEEGTFRTNDEIFVASMIKGEVIHQPPPHAELHNLLDALIHFFNDNTDFIHPVIKACIIHFMVGWIHPFTDGNGRTARALFYWYMMKNGYGLTEYLSISRVIKDTKNQYEKAYLYTENDDHDLGYFITYHIKTIIKAYTAFNNYIQIKQKETTQIIKFLNIEGVNNRMAQIIKMVYDDANRIFTNKEIENIFGVSNFTARADLRTLVKLGYLATNPINLKKVNFIKSKDFDTKIKALL